jgi:hypothetical protein
MIRTKNIAKPNPSAILCGYFHLRETIPVCRTDDFWTTQWVKVAFIKGLQQRYGCPVIHAGDLYDHWKPSPLLLSMAIGYLPERFMTIYGNHDLPQHSLDLAGKCGVNTLKEAGKLEVLNTCHWGTVPGEGSLHFPTGPGRHMLVWHVMTWQGRIPWPGCTDPSAMQILRKHPNCDLILTGHNHKTFVEEFKGRLLVNPGSLTRHDADQIDHRPCVFLWYAKTNEIVQVFIPIEKEVISREHIEHKQAHDTRIDAFIERLNVQKLKGFDFKGNLEVFQRTNQVRQSVMNIIWKAIEKE